MTLKQPSAQSYSKRLEAWAVGTIAAAEIALMVLAWVWMS